MKRDRECSTAILMPSTSTTQSSTSSGKEACIASEPRLTDGQFCGPCIHRQTSFVVSVRCSGQIIFRALIIWVARTESGGCQGFAVKDG
ncbi:unnamed protein product [Cladocopium goreaui]|uniref:Uncharacterized protein n=1 Tax=Cladocopium goreaui TaxID=2562237 RepID=A0A9P1G2L1_9DINO|nr:unnamed protein product [Cladocopium goreaui]